MIGSWGNIITSFQVLTGVRVFAHSDAFCTPTVALILLIVKLFTSLIANSYRKDSPHG